MAKAKETGMDPRQSYRSAMRGLIGARFGQVWKAVPVAVEGVDPEGVHDVRVASRRLRAAMDVADGCFPGEWYKPLHRAAKEITGALGDVRDRDVLIEFLQGERGRAPAGEHVGIDRLIARVAAERDEARVRMVAFLEELRRKDIAGEAVRRFGEDAAAPWMSGNGERS
ncbi:MAG: CHAD domain-containing protein [Thermomicrobiales bacterium]